MDNSQKLGTNRAVMDLRSIWLLALEELAVTLSQANLATWFRETSILELSDGAVVIGVPNAFTREWLEKKYHQDILRVLRKLTERDLTSLRYQVVARPAPATHKLTLGPLSHEDGLNPDYTFEHFIVGPSNRLAHAAALACAKKPGKVYNPLFIYGGVGLGKTHLIQAIGNATAGSDKEVSTLYVTCEKFTNDFIQAIQQGKVKAFKERYRACDVLLLDDVQFLAGKEGTQEEFFHTFNTLYQKGGQIVITSDRPPKQLSALEDRLVSRFEGGMVADISPPDFETRLAILAKKCQERREVVAEGVLEEIAQQVSSNIRELGGALNRVLAVASLAGQQATVELARDVLKDYVRRPGLSLEAIVQAVCATYNLDRESLFARRRDGGVVRARQVLMYLLREKLGWSYPRIGAELGRDHTTVIHGAAKVAQLRNHDQELVAELKLVDDQLGRL